MKEEIIAVGEVEDVYRYLLMRGVQDPRIKDSNA